ncbi:Arc family DNA-binding protein [Bordetella genomosp. 9]|uniref:Arc-like DNA binding domain-containing protein n=1 Tax=Bordetella genomosp. 9 TaxID=1416803 RepID=A0A1W6YYU0_9BORD|nr:Arc family DNA-binding protein [Bordetella genomosp. 9]ARP86275.1 hypothetical protein CAL13_08735 [Bordetella genomosp. 9]
MGRPRKSKVEEWDQFTLRLPPGMRDSLKELAAKHGRSMNSEILERLERSLSPNASLDLPTVRQVVREEVRAALTEAKRR